jgi:hypothetical protein
MLCSVLLSKITLFHCTQYEQCVHVTMGQISLCTMFFDWWIPALLCYCKNQVTMSRCQKKLTWTMIMSNVYNMTYSATMQKPADSFLLSRYIHHFSQIPMLPIGYWCDTNNWTTNNVTETTSLHLLLWSVWQPDNNELWLRILSHYGVVVRRGENISSDNECV